MWKQFYDFASQILNLTRRTEQNLAQIQELQKDFAKISTTVADMKETLQRVIYELHQVSENDRHEREKMALRLENELLKFERRLPTGKEFNDE